VPRFAFALIVLVFLGRALTALVAVPPWQEPDEPSHVNYLRIVTRQANAPVLEGDAESEREILRSMVKYQWWEHYGRPRPTSVPGRFEEADRATSLDAMLPGPRPYYIVAGWLVSLYKGGAVGELYLLRLLSVVFGAATLWVTWAAVSELYAQRTAMVVTSLAALHPQFAFVSASASPDALVILLGTVVWWQSMRLVRDPARITALALLWAAALIAIATKRLGFPLVFVAAGITVAAVYRAACQGWRPTPLVIARGAVVVATAGLAASMLAPQTVHTIFWRMFEETPLTGSTRVLVGLAWDAAAPFTTGLFESWWLAVGWGRYLPPRWWISIAYALAVIAFLGVAHRWLRAADGTTRFELGAMVTILLLQGAAVYWVFLRIGHGAQGRHLFPCLVPALVLLWLGIDQWVAIRYRAHAAVGIVTLFALLDYTGWMLVAFPAYFA
jgi:hypothetical protein